MVTSLLAGRLHRKIEQQAKELALLQWRLTSRQAHESDLAEEAIRRQALEREAATMHATSESRVGQLEAELRRSQESHADALAAAEATWREAAVEARRQVEAAQAGAAAASHAAAAQAESSALAQAETTRQLGALSAARRELEVALEAERAKSTALTGQLAATTRILREAQAPAREAATDTRLDVRHGMEEMSQVAAAALRTKIASLTCMLREQQEEVAEGHHLTATSKLASALSQRRLLSLGLAVGGWRSVCLHWSAIEVTRRKAASKAATALAASEAAAAAARADVAELSQRARRLEEQLAAASSRAVADAAAAAPRTKMDSLTRMLREQQEEVAEGHHFAATSKLASTLSQRRLLSLGLAVGGWRSACASLMLSAVDVQQRCVGEPDVCPYPFCYMRWDLTQAHRQRESLDGAPRQRPREPSIRFLRMHTSRGTRLLTTLFACRLRPFARVQTNVMRELKR